MKKGIKVYNLYPKLVGKMDKWPEHFNRAAEMGFDHIYLNPLHAPGFSGSDYAVKDYFLYHPLFVTGEYDFADLPSQRAEGDRLLKMVCDNAAEKGMKVLMDLVINHTAIDSPLTQAHPDWYEKNNDGTIKNPGALDGNNWIVWGDLAQINNEHSSDRDNLWDYWLDMMLYYCDLGIRGFRCDAAYHLPLSLWRFLTKKVKAKYPDAIFIAETLGCDADLVPEVADAGFDYVMNSFKWWNLKDEWFLKDYSKWAGRYPSLTFPENHDTPRFSEETNGNKNLAVMKYALEAYFCAGIAITVGYEFGFRKKIDVVQTNPTWWEEKTYDISEEIKKINEIKSQYEIFNEDNMINIYYFDNQNLFGFTKQSRNGKEKIFVVANINGDHTQHVFVNDIYALLGGNNLKDISHGHRMSYINQNFEYTLEPGEVKVIHINY